MQTDWETGLQFLVGAVEEHSRTLLWKSWNKLAMNKDEGGLGFRDIQCFNSVLLAKQLWRLLTHSNLLMSKVLKAKYFPHGGLLNVVVSPQASWLWKSWMSAKGLLQQGLRYQVGDGKAIRIWDASWLHTTSTFRPTTIRPVACCLNWVSELMVAGGKQWNKDLIQQTFNEYDTNTILQIPISQLGLKDRLV